MFQVQVFCWGAVDDKAEPRGLTGFVLLPSLFNHSVLMQAASVDSMFLNKISYPVFVVPIPATCLSWVVDMFNNVILIWLLAVIVVRYCLEQSLPFFLLF